MSPVAAKNQHSVHCTTCVHPGRANMLPGLRLPEATSSPALPGRQEGRGSVPGVVASWWGRGHGTAPGRRLQVLAAAVGKPCPPCCCSSSPRRVLHVTSRVPSAGTSQSLRTGFRVPAVWPLGANSTNQGWTFCFEQVPTCSQGRGCDLRCALGVRLGRLSLDGGRQPRTQDRHPCFHVPLKARLVRHT